MNTLPKGITGFYHISQNGIPETEKSLVENIVKSFENNSDFWKVSLTQQQADNNFYIISVSDKNGDYKIGVNSTYPFYCGIKSLADWTNIEFCDLPKNVTELLPFGFTELRTDFLNEPLKPKHITALNKAELKQIEYWKTEKVGNVIFNKYD